MFLLSACVEPRVVQGYLIFGSVASLQAGDYQKTARFYYKKAEDTYYQVLFEATLRTVTMQSARCSRARLACTQNCCCVSGPAGLRCVAGAVPRAIVVFACNGHSRRVFSLLTPSATVRPTTGPRTTTGAAPATSGTTSTTATKRLLGRWHRVSRLGRVASSAELTGVL